MAQPVCRGRVETGAPANHTGYRRTGHYQADRMMNMKKSTLYCIALLAALLPAAALAAESGTALKADSLRAEPYADAKTTGSLARGDKLQIISKQGAWLKVQTAKTTGWVRLLSVKRGTTSSSGNSAADVLNLASGRSGTGQVVATTG